MKQELIDAIVNAIHKEEGEHNLYVHLLDKADNPDTKTLFEALSVEELKHEELLRECILTNKEINEVKKEDYQRYIGELKVCDQINPFENIKSVVEGFEVALKNERDAQLHYKKLMQDTNNPELKKLFELLLKEEKKHEEQLSKEFNRLYRPNDVEDEKSTEK